MYDAIRYVENDAKTDKTMYVSGINCSKHNAYNEMIAVKRRFGERGKNMAYHGYQSFVSGEVTPEEAHQIGLETARQMWGDKYQVVVTTHLNTDNIYYRFVGYIELPEAPPRDNYKADTRKGVAVEYIPKPLSA